MNQQNCNCTSSLQPMPYMSPTLNGDIFQCDVPLAMAYVPWQTWNKTYDLDKALQTGTIFPCLDKPFMGRCACK
jgi:hypothetical protein